MFCTRQAFLDNSNVLKQDRCRTGQCSVYFLDVYGHVTVCATIMSAVATGTNISCSLGRQYKLVLSLSFLDVYGHFTECGTLKSAKGHRHNHFWQLGQAVRASDKSIFPRCLWERYSMWHHYVCSDHRHNHFLQLGLAVWASAQSIFLRCLWASFSMWHH